MISSLSKRWCKMTPNLNFTSMKVTIRTPSDLLNLWREKKWTTLTSKCKDCMSQTRHLSQAVDRTTNHLSSPQMCATHANPYPRSSAAWTIRFSKPGRVQSSAAISTQTTQKWQITPCTWTPVNTVTAQSMVMVRWFRTMAGMWFCQTTGLCRGAACHLRTTAVRYQSTKASTCPSRKA